MIGGEAGIRTLGRGIPFNGFQDRRIQPLCHLSVDANINRNMIKLQRFFLFFLKKVS